MCYQKYCLEREEFLGWGHPLATLKCFSLSSISGCYKTMNKIFIVRIVLYLLTNLLCLQMQADT